MDFYFRKSPFRKQYLSEWIFFSSWEEQEGWVNASYCIPYHAYANRAVGKRETIISWRVEVRTRLQDLSKEATSITINDDRVHVNARVYIFQRNAARAGLNPPIVRVSPIAAL